MIVHSIFVIINGILGIMFNALPTSSLPLVDGTTDTTFWNGLGTTIGQWNGLVPIIECLTIGLTVLQILLPAILAYKVLNWIYKHIPQIGGFGPGSG